MKMNRNILSHRHVSFVISLMLAACAPVAAQQTPDNLGGAFKSPAGAKITSTIIDRLALGSRKRNLADKRSDTGSKPSNSVLFGPTGTQLKTREIANLIAAGTPQVLNLLSALLEEFDKGAREAG